MKRSGLLLAIMLVIVVNITVLAGVWYNRSGPPEAVVTVTERELSLVRSSEDDSGVMLRMDYRRPDLDDEDETWLDRAKLEELDFEYPEGEPTRNFNLIRAVFLVLELEQEAPEQQSRLVVRDAGIDPEELRRKYSDRSRFIIAPGVVRLFFYGDDDAEDDEQPQSYVQSLRTSLIHVPKEHAAFLRRLPYGAHKEPRYAVTLRYGRRLEPWVVKVESLQ